MAWQSIFDAGTCTVTVSNAGVTQWSGVLAKGSSSPLFHGVGGANESMQVSVDGSGQVSLAWQPGATHLTDNYTVSVNPTAPSVLGLGCRATNVGLYVHAVGQLGAAADVQLPATAIGLGYTGTPPGVMLMSPNPVDLSAQPNPVAIAVAMGTTGPLALAGTLANGALGTPYSSSLSASGGWPGYTWAISAGTLPPGLSLNTATGLISGTPS